MRKDIKNFLVLVYIIINLMVIAHEGGSIWGNNVLYLNNRTYPMTQEYYWFRGYRYVIENNLRIKEIRKPEIFLWIKNGE
jgi:hypothetical protein